jgi:hypothetical protein
LGILVWSITINTMATYGDLNGPIPRTDPETYTLDFSLHATLIGTMIFVWWAWIPLATYRLHLSQNNSKNKSSGSHHSAQSRDRHHTEGGANSPTRGPYNPLPSVESTPEKESKQEETQPFIPPSPLLLTSSSPQLPTNELLEPASPSLAAPSSLLAVSEAPTADQASGVDESQRDSSPLTYLLNAPSLQLLKPPGSPTSRVGQRSESESERSHSPLVGVGEGSHGEAHKVGGGELGGITEADNEGQLTTAVEMADFYVQ